MADPYLTSLEQQYKLPPGILEATRTVETGGNPSQVSKAGAIGPFQFMPATAKALGIDPRNPKQAAEGAARLWAENLRATNGDIDTAARMYQGGPDRSKWGAANAAYPGQILAALQGQSASSPQPQDDYERALSGGTLHQEADDQFEQALVGGSVPNNDGIPAVHGHQTADRVGDHNGVRRAGSLETPGSTAVTTPAAQASPGAGQQALDFAQGGVQGFSTVPDTAWSAVDWAARKLGIDPNAIAQGGDNAKSHMFDSVVSPLLAPAIDALRNLKPTDSAAYKLGKFLGEGAATAPIAELTPFGDSTFARRMGNYMLQGAGAGAATSEGNDVLSRAGVGALAAPLIGGSLEGIVAPAALKASSLAKALTRRIGDRLNAVEELPFSMDLPPALKAEVTAAPRASASGAEPQMQATGPATTSGDQLPPLAAEQAHGFPLQDADGRPLVGIVDNGAGGYAPQYGDIPKQESQGGSQTSTQLADLLAARGAAGARRGIESAATLPQSVADDAQALIQQGVPEDQALNEAAIRHVGGEPTLGSSTRDFETMQTEQELAKEAGTPEGQMLRARQADNNAALHDTVQNTVTGYGGIPAQGEAAEAVANSLAKASDDAYAKVQKAYTDARAQDGDKRASIDGLRELLDQPNFRAPTTSEGKQLVVGLRAQIDEMTRQNRGRFTPDEIEQLWQEANRAYSPMGSGANAMIGDVKKALSESLDQFDQAGPAFKAARAAHRQWAQQYADPEGVARLVARDANGNFVNGDNWRKVENGLIGTTSDKGFIQVVRQLAQNGDTAALGKLKADIVQRAYEAATRGNADHFGNPLFVARNWHDALNKVGMPKLQAIFTPEELGHLSVVGHAARALNESIPGSVNGSGTASALVNAARRVKNGAPVSPAARNVARALRGMGHAGATLVAPGKGNLMVEGVSSMAGKVAKAQATRAAGKQLGNAIVRTLDPDMARSADAEQLARLIARRNLARALAKGTASASAATNGQGQ